MRHEDIKNVLEDIAKVLVNHPSEVRVQVIRGRWSTVFKLTVNPMDLGMVIGRAGYLAESMRDILEATGFLRNENFVLNIPSDDR